jgi:hypothetical protein
VYAYDSDYDGRCKPVIYTDYGNIPLNRKSKTEGAFDVAVKSGKPAGWRSTAFQSDGSIAAGSYIWFGLFCDWFAPRFDFGAKCYKDFWDYQGDDILNTYPLYNANSYYDFKLSMYFTYTSAQNYTRTLTQGVKLTDSRKLTANYKRIAVLDGQNTTVLGHGAQYFHQYNEEFTGLDALRYERGFLRTIAEQIHILNPLGYCRDFLRSIVNTARPFTAESRSVANRRDIASTAGSGEHCRNEPSGGLLPTA